MAAKMINAEEWVWVNSPVYCRPHGLKIVGHHGNVPQCRRCWKESMEAEARIRGLQRT